MTSTQAAPGRRARMAAAWRSGPLGVAGFRLLTAGQFASTIGDYCYAVALPWLVLSDGGSAASLGIVLACYGIPRALLTVAGGSLADRFGPRAVMLASDAARCALTAVFAVLAAEHVSSLAAVAPVAALLGAGSALFGPASMTMMPALVEGPRLTSANALYTGVVQVGSMLGPALGGVLVAATGPAPAFAVDAGSFLVSAASVALIRGAGGRPGREGAVADASAGTDPLAGTDALTGTDALGGTDALTGTDASAGSKPESVWGLLRRSPILQIILVVSVTANFALTGTTEVALPALAHARFGADGYGAVLTCVAAASIVGALFVARVGDRFRPVILIAAAFLFAAVAIAVAPFLGGLPGLAAGLAGFGLAIGFDQVVSVTLIQRWAPPALLGRVWGLLILASAGSFPVSTFIAGLLARHLGPTPVFPISGAVLALAMLFGLSKREFREFDVSSQGTGA
jgi:MFS family permease